LIEVATVQNRPDGTAGLSVTMKEFYRSLLKKIIEKIMILFSYFYNLERKVSSFVVTFSPAIRSYGFYESYNTVKMQLQKPQKLLKPKAIPLLSGLLFMVSMCI